MIHPNFLISILAIILITEMLATSLVEMNLVGELSSVFKNDDNGILPCSRLRSEF